MAALDTNVLVRYLVQDDAKQGLLARELIRSTLAKGEPLFIPMTVIIGVGTAIKIWLRQSTDYFNSVKLVRCIGAVFRV
jgi:predicted nucleic-acid-binding protein